MNTKNGQIFELDFWEGRNSGLGSFEEFLCSVRCRRTVLVLQLFLRFSEELIDSSTSFCDLGVRVSVWGGSRRRSLLAAFQVRYPEKVSFIPSKLPSLMLF